MAWVIVSGCRSVVSHKSASMGSERGEPCIHVTNLRAASGWAG